MSDSKKELNSIATQLWAMANQLRGNMDASEYKNYILAFMFYRYLSEHQENYLVTNQVIDVAPGQSINEAYKAEAEEDLDGYLEDISSALGYVISPENTWKSLVEKIENNEIVPSDYQNMFDSFDKNAKINSDAKEDFRGIFSDVNLGDSRLGNSTTARAKSLNGIVTLVDDINYKSEDGKDILGEIYEYLIGQFSASAGKKGGEFYTPHQISKILAKIVTLEPQNGEEQFTVYDPTMGSGSLLLTVRNELPDGDKVGAVKFYGQELNTTTYNLARMNLMMHGVTYANMQLKNADTLETDWPDGPDDNGIDHPRRFNAVVANPPYSAQWDNNEGKLKDPRFSEYGKLAPKSKADYAFILHSIYHLDEDGTMAIVLPHGVLFRGGAEETIRKTLIDKNYLDAVIGIPEKVFYGTSIPTTILVFKKNRKNKEILFIDASSDFEKGKNQNILRDEDVNRIIDTYAKREDIERYAHVASVEEIKENEYNLNIPRYVDTFEPEEEIDINEIDKQLEEDNKEIARLETEIKRQISELVEMK